MRGVERLRKTVCQSLAPLRSGPCTPVGEGPGRVARRSRTKPYCLARLLWLLIRGGSEVMKRAHASCESNGINLWHAAVDAYTLKNDLNYEAVEPSFGSSSRT